MIQNGFTGQAVHPGSWFGLPDFGVTEAIGGLFGGQRTAQGGSNLYGPQSSANYTPSSIPNPTPTFKDPQAGVKGLQTNRVATNQTPAAPAQTFDANAAQNQLMGQVDSAYGDVYGNLNNQESQLRGGEQDLYNSFTQPYDAQQPILDQARDQGLQLNQSQVNDTNQTKENALAAARRLYQELSQGVQQRFGGNSAGEFANAFYGREFQRGQGNIQNTAGQNIQKLYDAATKINEDHEAQTKQLSMQKEAALSQARDVFNQRLTAINNARLGADTNKAQLKLQALQDLRSTIANVQSSALAYQQQIQSQVAQMQGQLAANVQAYKAQAGQATDLNAIPDAVYSQFGNPQQQSTQYLNNVYGSFNPNAKKDQYGNIIG
jgi:hypothetical protein